MNLTSLDLGIYNVTIQFIDTSGNFVNDTVQVTIGDTTQTTDFFDLTVFIVLGGAMAAVVIVVILIKIR